MSTTITIEEAGQSITLAYETQRGGAPTVVFLPGFASNMRGTKAVFLAEHCAAKGYAYCRFDYRGHGQSSGSFEDGTIGAWRDDVLSVLDAVTEGPLLLVGSSMGGWIALLTALARPARVAGLVGIASAPDFTERLLRPSLSFAERSLIDSVGRFDRPSEYGTPLPITRALLDEAKNHQLLGGNIEINVPCQLLHGQEDPDVPWELSIELASRLVTNHVSVELIKDGDHRLSRPSDLARVAAAVDRLVEVIKRGGDGDASA